MEQPNALISAIVTRKINIDFNNKPRIRGLNNIYWIVLDYILVEVWGIEPQS